MEDHNLNLIYWNYPRPRGENVGGYQKVYVEKKDKDPPCKCEKPCEKCAKELR